jgi:catechol 2,3-dioxygenase-like lactoylglutathione lyase family enzyme
MSRDVEASIRFYAKLGFDVAFRDDPDRVRYAGVRRDGVELHLQWHDAGGWDVPGDRPTYRFVVDDVDRLRAEFREQGIAADITEVRDTPWGTREFHVRDPDRNGLQFYCDL